MKSGWCQQCARALRAEEVCEMVASRRFTKRGGVAPLSIVAILSALFGACTHMVLTSSSSSSPSSRVEGSSGDNLFVNLRELQQLVARQNETIVALRRNEQTSTDSCESRFGQGLVNSYATSREAWCQGGQSSLFCYRHSYAHNSKKTGLFCEGFNITIDGSRVKGAPVAQKVRGGDLYLSFGLGATSADCSRTSQWKQGLLMPHMSLQLRGLVTGPTPAGARRESGTTYLMARDEDCENMFHSTADHLNAYLVGEILRLDWNTVKTLLWDRHPDGPFKELIERAYSGGAPLSRASRDTVVYERLIFHLESPAGIVFPKVAGPRGVMRCRGSSLWQGYSKHVLKSFGEFDVPPPDLPNVLMSVRRRTKAKNVGRVFSDENTLVSVLKQGNGMRYEVVDLATLTFAEQLAKVRRANVLVGAHGAGLMHVLFLADEAVLLEIHPSYRLDRHFRLAARMAGKMYLPMRSTAQVTCSGSSDSIPVDKDEFEKALDGAIRLARNFDGGVAECGLRCDPRILALDPQLRPHLSEREKRVSPLSTRFPC